MTWTIKSEHINGYVIYIEQEKYSAAYKVGVCEEYDECRCGYPISERLYITKEQALRRFRDLKRRVIRGEI